MAKLYSWIFFNWNGKLLCWNPFSFFQFGLNYFSGKWLHLVAGWFSYYCQLFVWSWLLQFLHCFVFFVFDTGRKLNLHKTFSFYILCPRGNHLYPEVNYPFIITLRKKCPYSELFWSVFPRIWTEYGEILLCFVIITVIIIYSETVKCRFSEMLLLLRINISVNVLWNFPCDNYCNIFK